VQVSERIENVSGEFGRSLLTEQLAVFHNAIMQITPMH
jgi:hypothetical protein